MSNSPDTQAVIAIDSSTTSTKVMAFDLYGQALVEVRHGYPRSNPHPGWQEQDPISWWEATRAGLRDVAAALRDLGRTPLSLCITHQRETFVLLDEEDQAIRPAILWLDTRAGEQIERVGSDYIHGLSGKPASATPSFYKMIWLLENEPETMKKAARVAEVHEYLVHHLTGLWKTSWATMDPMAILDMKDFTYSDALLAFAGLHRDQMSDLVAPGSIIGPVTDALADDLGLPRRLPVVAGAGDGQSAGLGANVTSSDRAYLSLGTSMAMGVHSQEYLYSKAFRTLSSPIAGEYTLEALLSAGVLSVAWFSERLSGMSDADGPIEPRLELLAARVPPGSRGVQFLPYLSSAETPYWDTMARAAFVGLSDTHGVAEMYRAILEGLAVEERLNLKRIEKATGVKVERVSVLGGAARSELFTQIIADALQRPLDLCQETETTCLGAAMLAAAAVGACGQNDVRLTAARMAHVSRVIEPNPDLRKTFKLISKAHDALYPALKPVFPVIAELREMGGNG